MLKNHNRIVGYLSTRGHFALDRKQQNDSQYIRAVLIFNVCTTRKSVLSSVDLFYCAILLVLNSSYVHQLYRSVILYLDIDITIMRLLVCSDNKWISTLI